MTSRKGFVARASAAFVRGNIAASQALESVFPRDWREFPIDNARFTRASITPGLRVADVGGGKKPFVQLEEKQQSGIAYTGIDIDETELLRAPPGLYDNIAVVDLQSVPRALHSNFDLIICRFTLEHVQDARAALEGLGQMLAPGGRCIGVLPCRNALFAQLNLRVPEGLKRRVLHGLYPNKTGDGFPAYYDRATPSRYRAMIEAQGFRLLHLERRFWSSYFSAFTPVYALWRLATIAQRLIDPDYCESFWFAFEKRSNS